MKIRRISAEKFGIQTKGEWFNGHQNGQMPEMRQRNRRHKGRKTARFSVPFCGEEIVDIPEIKEGEQFEYSDVPAEKDTKKIEPVGEEIDLSFVLSEEEVGNALETSGKLKSAKSFPLSRRRFSDFSAFSLFFRLFSAMPGFSEWAKPSLTFPTIS